MGATQFITESYGASAEAAFNDAVGNALHWHGHGGYTGTIAEKNSFVMVEVGSPKQPDYDLT